MINFEEIYIWVIDFVYIYMYMYRFTRLVVFTLEVAIGTMPKNVHQMIILFDASKSHKVVNEFKN